MQAAPDSNSLLACNKYSAQGSMLTMQPLWGSRAHLEVSLHQGIVGFCVQTMLPCIVCQQDHAVCGQPHMLRRPVLLPRPRAGVAVEGFLEVA